MPLPFAMSSIHNFLSKDCIMYILFEVLLATVLTTISWRRSMLFSFTYCLSIEIVNLDESDIIRHKLVDKIIKAYKNKND